jgi:hypothetical protein
VGRAAFKKGSIPRAVAMPSHSPHASRPSTFRAPGWGAPVLPSSCCRWRSATSWGLAPFSHRSASRIFIMQPGCIPSPMVIQDDDHQFGGGEKQAGLQPLPRPQLQGSSSPVLGRRAGRVGACLRVGRRPASSSGIRGRKTSSSSAEEASSSHAREGELLLPGQGATVRPPPGRWLCRARVSCVQVLPAPSAAQHVVRREGGTHVLGRSRSRLVARTEVRTCRCASGRPPLAGAVSVGSRRRLLLLKRLPLLTRPSALPALRASGSLALIAGSRPP